MMPILQNPWPHVIAYLRHSKELTQEAAAESAGVSVKTWYRWEKEGFYPNDKQLEKIQQALGCGAEEIGRAYARKLAGIYLPGLLPGEAAEGRHGPADDLRDPVIRKMRHAAEPADPVLAGDEIGCVELARERTYAIQAAITHVVADLIEHEPLFEDFAPAEARERLAEARALIDDLLSLSRALGEALTAAAKILDREL